MMHPSVGWDADCLEAFLRIILPCSLPDLEGEEGRQSWQPARWVYEQFRLLQRVVERYLCQTHLNQWEAEKK